MRNFRHYYAHASALSVTNKKNVEEIDGHVEIPTATMNPIAEKYTNNDPLLKDYIQKLVDNLQFEKTRSENYLAKNRQLKDKVSQLENEIKTLKLKKERLEEINDKLQRDMTLIQISQKSNAININTQAIANGSTTVSDDPATHNAGNCINGDDDDSNCIIVKGLHKNALASSLPGIILDMGRAMKLKLTKDDLKRVTIMKRKFYERHNLETDTMILIVQFHKLDMKVDFLKHKEKCKKHPAYTSVNVEDYVSENTYNLCQYAKILKTYGYAAVYWRNNCVYAKKTNSTDCKEIPIHSRSQVDVLKFSI
uniref:Uncharacterized protein n=1 Tax=Glossina morsitans morsitans TaxID=37546 RepID=A0A1B0FMM9_GLOMM